MFKKTAAIAVLILLVSSTFAGTVTAMPVAGQANADAAGYTAPAQRSSPGAFSASKGAVSGTSGLASESFVVYVNRGEPAATAVDEQAPGNLAHKLLAFGNMGPAPLGAARGMWAGIFARMVPGDYPAGNGATSHGIDNGSTVTTQYRMFNLKGDVTDAGGASAKAATVSYAGGVPEAGGPGELRAGYSTMRIDFNNSSLTMTAPPPNPFAFKDKERSGGWNPVKVVNQYRMLFAGPVNLSIKSPVQLFSPDGDELWKSEMVWEARHVVVGEAGDVEFFTHSRMPAYGGFPDPSGTPFPDDAVVFNGSMMMDLADVMGNMTSASDATADADPYDNEIAGGETQWHSVTVGDVKSVNVDLKWPDANGSLRLVIYTPDGKVLGPYDDASDGSVDGRINLNIANPSGVAEGEWYLKVTDTSPLGKDEYYVKTY